MEVEDRVVYEHEEMCSCVHIEGKNLELQIPNSRCASNPTIPLPWMWLPQPNRTCPISGSSLQSYIPDIKGGVGGHRKTTNQNTTEHNT
jgi:hypothetical protein